MKSHRIGVKWLTFDGLITPEIWFLRNPFKEGKKTWELKKPKKPPQNHHPNPKVNFWSASLNSNSPLLCEYSSSKTEETCHLCSTHRAYFIPLDGFYRKGMVTSFSLKKTLSCSFWWDVKVPERLAFQNNKKPPQDLKTDKKQQGILPDSLWNISIISCQIVTFLALSSSVFKSASVKQHKACDTHESVTCSKLSLFPTQATLQYVPKEALQRTEKHGTSRQISVSTELYHAQDLPNSVKPPCVCAFSVLLSFS